MQRLRNVLTSETSSQVKTNAIVDPVARNVTGSKKNRRRLFSRARKVVSAYRSGIGTTARIRPYDAVSVTVLIIMIPTSVSATATSESKFLVPAVVAPRICEWARAYFAPDCHGSGPYADEYDTCTLYFDTPQLDVLYRRGSYGRAKYRVRRYGSSGEIFLERKLRKPGFLFKRRTVGPIDALDLLKDTEVVHGWYGEWFQRRLLARRLRPVCQISYHRIARTLDSPDGAARLTIDTALRIGAMQEVDFDDASTMPLLASHVIVELKYGDCLPAVCRRLVEEFALTAHTLSKYRLGMAGLSRSPALEYVSVLAAAGVSHADVSHADVSHA
jgi:hypothetical protein